MDTATLVNLDIEKGSSVIRALDEEGKSLNVAMWAKLPQYEDWRLVIASEKFNQESNFRAYGELGAALQKAGIPPRKQPAFALRPMNRPFVQALRDKFASLDDTYGMRLGGQMFGDQYLEDAFVYRIR